MKHRRCGRGSRRLALETAFVLAVLSWGLQAEADGIPWPSSCPPGSQEGGCHWSEYCSPDTCDDDSDCHDDQTCREIDHCMGSASCTSNPGEEPPETYSRPDVLGVCDGDTECDGECVTHRVCLDPGESADGDLRAGCSCRTGGDGQVHVVFAVIIGLAMVLLFRVRAGR